MEIIKSIVESQWVEIKEKFDENTNGSKEYGQNFEIGGELDLKALAFLELLEKIHEECGGDCVAEGIKLDLWKERIWYIIENAGLLEPIAWKTDLDEDNSWMNIKDFNY